MQSQRKHFPFGVSIRTPFCLFLDSEGVRIYQSSARKVTQLQKIQFGYYCSNSSNLGATCYMISFISVVVGRTAMYAICPFAAAKGRQLVLLEKITQSSKLRRLNSKGFALSCTFLQLYAKCYNVTLL